MKREDIALNYLRWYRRTQADRTGCGGPVLLACLLAVLLLVGCRTHYVPVETVCTEHHWHTDTLRQTDSVIDHRTTIIREADSALMAQYGIELRSTQRVWLVETDRLRRELSRLQSLVETRDTVRDTLRVPVPVERTLSRWEAFCIDYGKVMLGVALAAVLMAVLAASRAFRHSTP